MEISKKSDQKFWNILLVSLASIFILTIIFGFADAANIPSNKRTVLLDMNEVGFLFDSTLVEVELMNGENDAIVTGPMIGLKEILTPGDEIPVKDQNNYTRFKKVELAKQGSQWLVVNQEKR